MAERQRSPEPPERIGDALDRVLDASQRLFSDRLDLAGYDMRAAANEWLFALVWVGLGLVATAIGWVFTAVSLALLLSPSVSLPGALLVVGLVQLGIGALLLRAARSAAPGGPSS